MVRAYLGLGSNMDNSIEHLALAAAEIDRWPRTRVVRSSRLYGSKPWGKRDQPDFANMVLEIDTELSPLRLLAACKAAEKSHGRVPGERWGPRPLDIDILLYNEKSVAGHELTIPHPRLWERAFVLRPLFELLPDLRSADGRSIAEALADPAIAEQGVWLITERNT